MESLPSNISNKVRDEIGNGTLERKKELLKATMSNQNKNPLAVTSWRNTSTKKMDSVPQFNGDRNGAFAIAQHHSVQEPFQCCTYGQNFQVFAKQTTGL